MITIITVFISLYQARAGQLIILWFLDRNVETNADDEEETIEE